MASTKNEFYSLTFKLFALVLFQFLPVTSQALLPTPPAVPSSPTYVCRAMTTGTVLCKENPGKDMRCHTIEFMGRIGTDCSGYAQLKDGQWELVEGVLDELFKNEVTRTPTAEATRLGQQVL
jgi:Fe-S-cluster containining protein